jgi:hypothetical protein
MNSDPHWTAYLSALLVPVIAMFGAFIAYRQWRTAQNELKHDLYDRRYSIYKSAAAFLSVICRDGGLNDEDLFKFASVIHEARWLLNNDVAKYFDDELYSKAVDLQTLNLEIKDLPVGVNRTVYVKKRADLMKWFMSQWTILNEKFSPFLALQH